MTAVTLRRHRAALAVLAAALIFLVTDGGGCDLEHLLPPPKDAATVQSP
jgi:hypothetical protein